MKLSSTASPDVPAQTFEVDSARSPSPGNPPHQSRSRRYHDLDRDGGGHRSPCCSPAGSAASGSETELLLVTNTFAGDDDSWSLVTVTALTPATDPATGAINTRVDFTAPGGGRRRNRADAPRRRYRPPTPPATGCCARPPRPRSSTQPRCGVRIRRHATSGRSRRSAIRDRRVRTTVHLSAAVRAISPGDMVLFDCGVNGASALAVVTATWTCYGRFPIQYVPDAFRDPGEDGTASPTRRTSSSRTRCSTALATPDSYVLLDAQRGHARDPSPSDTASRT